MPRRALITYFISILIVLFFVLAVFFTLLMPKLAATGQDAPSAQERT